MLIYGEIDDRLESVVTFDPAYSQGNYLLVIHPHDTDEWVEQDLREVLIDERCRGVLIVKGVPRGGLTSAKLDELKTLYGGRFHASACSVGSRDEATKLEGDLEARFRAFFRHVRTEDYRVDWSILDPQWPAKIISAYLLAKALSDDKKEAQIIESQSGDWATIWEDAKTEYRLLTNRNLPHSELNTRTAGDIAKQIMQHLQNVSARTK